MMTNLPQEYQRLIALKVALFIVSLVLLAIVTFLIDMALLLTYHVPVWQVAVGTLIPWLIVWTITAIFLFHYTKAVKRSTVLLTLAGEVISSALSMLIVSFIKRRSLGKKEKLTM